MQLQLLLREENLATQILKPFPFVSHRRKWGLFFFHYFLIESVLLHYLQEPQCRRAFLIRAKTLLLPCMRDVPILGILLSTRTPPSGKKQGFFSSFAGG